MINCHFISYSSFDAADFALQLYDLLRTDMPSYPPWLDRYQIQPGEDWDEAINEGIRACRSLLFVMSHDSVAPQSVCKLEWSRALHYKKPIVPILLHPDVEVPFGIGTRRTHIDFTQSFEVASARLCNRLRWLVSPQGELDTMKHRLDDAQRDLGRATPERSARIEEDIGLLERQIAELQRAVDDPVGTAARVEKSIAIRLQTERQPQEPATRRTFSKFINPPPSDAPQYFQDRYVETRLIGEFLRNASQRLMVISGRGGIGKTALACRLLKALENGLLPDGNGPLHVDGVVYLSAIGSHRISVPNIFGDLIKLLPTVTAEELQALFRREQTGTQIKMERLLAEFPQGCTVLFLDNFENLIDPESRCIGDIEIFEVLRALLNAPHHAIKVILTTRIAPRDLNLLQPGRQTRLDVDEGLPSPYAENILREMDVDGKLGLRDASPELLDEARRRTRGYPRALEHLFAILSADRDTSLQEVLADTNRLLPEQVVDVLVGEAFARLDLLAQQVIQALAVYRRPVTPTAVDFLLQPYVTGIDSVSVISRLVNMQFIRKETGRYHLHPLDSAYALGRLATGEKSDRDGDRFPRFTQFALRHRGAEYFRQARKPRADWRTIDDLAPQLAEFDLRCDAQDYDTAGRVLFAIDWDYLYVWGTYQLIVELHERLRGKLDDRQSAVISLGTLGSAYAKCGRISQAIASQEEALALARESAFRNHQSAMLSNLALRHIELGQILRAVDYCNESLTIARECFRPEEEAALRNLGDCSAHLGDAARSIQYLEEALTIARELGDQRRESMNLERIARACMDTGELGKAIVKCEEALRIADSISFVQVQNDARLSLAEAYLSRNEMETARVTLAAMQKFEVPKNDHKHFALLGIIALHQKNCTDAQDAFITAIKSADSILAQCDQYYEALDSKALASCGLALCADAGHVSAALSAYNAARSINRHAGTVRRVLRLFDVLIAADPTGSMAMVRSAAGGNSDLNA